MNNNLCINTDNGCVWGNIIDWATANKLAEERKGEMRYKGNIMDDNGKVYVWLKDYPNYDNYFVGLKY